MSGIDVKVRWDNGDMVIYYLCGGVTAVLGVPQTANPEDFDALVAGFEGATEKAMSELASAERVCVCGRPRGAHEVFNDDGTLFCVYTETEHYEEAAEVTV